MFNLEYSKQALSFLKKSDRIIVSRIIIKVESLREKPIIHDTKRVEGFKEKLFRVRVGDYRILYEVGYSRNVVGIVKIDKRARVY